MTYKNKIDAHILYVHAFRVIKPCQDCIQGYNQKSLGTTDLVLQLQKNRPLRLKVSPRSYSNRDDHSNLYRNLLFGGQENQPQPPEHLVFYTFVWCHEKSDLQVEYT